MNFAAAAQRINAYERLIRLDKPIGALLLLWPTLWAVWLAGRGRPPWDVVIIFVAGVFLMRSAGCAVNDFADRDFDGRVERTRTRPLAAREIAPWEALAVAAALAAIAFGFALFLNRLALLLTLPALAIAASYPFAKRVFALPQLYLGIAFGFGIPMAYAALRASLPWECWALHPHLGAHARALRRRRGGGELRADARGARRARRGAAARLGLPCRAHGRRGDDDLPLQPDPRSLARGLLPRLPAQQLGRRRDLRRHRAVVLDVSQDAPLAEFEIRSGAQRGSRLTLFANRLVHKGASALETMPLAHLAAVRVAFERDARKLNWAIALLVAAFLCAAIASPLQHWFGALGARLGASGRSESLDALVASVLAGLQTMAGLLPWLAALLAAGAAALGALFALGTTRLTLSFAAVQRGFEVRGRSRFLLEFAETVSEQLAARVR
jgi:UbiA prenyltransferase family